MEFLVVNEDLTPLLEAEVIQQMGLIKVHTDNFEQVAAASTSTFNKTPAASAANRII